MINLKFNYPSVDTEALVMQEVLHKADVKKLLSFPSYEGTPEVIEAGKRYLKVAESDVVMCNSGNHSLTCILELLRRTHHKIITEPFTYPAFKAIAHKLLFELVSAETDEEGLTLTGLEDAYLRTKAQVLYVQPTIQNPTCTVMSANRRKEVADFCRRHNIFIIEDDAYRFLHPNPPPTLLSLLPEQTFHIFSLAKPFNSMLKTAFVVTPKFYTKALIDNIRLTSSGQSALLSHIVSALLNDNLIENIIAEKQVLGKEVQSRILPLLKNFPVASFENGFHLWMSLPEHIRSTALVRDLERDGILVPSGTEFTVEDAQKGERFIRIALGAEKRQDILSDAIEAIKMKLG